MATSCYVHIPFCDDICTYCDFCKIYKKSGNVLKYLNALEQEIRKYYRGEALKTLYVGGGTPSSLSLSELKQLFQILDIFVKEEQIEYTVECNIESITREKLLLFQQYGVNRISIGIESVDELSIQLLGRHHTRKQVEDGINMVKEVGFTNINVDLMYAFPWQTKSSFLDDLSFFCSLKVPHISTYSLILEEHTVLYQKKLEPIAEELDLWMYQKIEETLKELGYHHYEFSNFAMPGYESKHNLVYWNNEKYYGFGLGVSGYIDSIRYQNTRSILKYASGISRLEEHQLSKKEEMENECILGLRKMEGVSKERFLKKFHIPIEEVFPIQKLKEKQFLKEKNGYLYIPEKYLYISNEILLEFID